LAHYYLFLIFLISWMNNPLIRSARRTPPLRRIFKVFLKIF
jgi:hypothetical protein